MEENIISMENVSFINDNYTVLENINLTIKKESITSIIGSSGAGKSTLLKLMAGLLIPNTGKVTILGTNLHDQRSSRTKEIKKRIGFAFQDAALLSNLSIKENLLLPLDFHFPLMEQEEKEEKMMILMKKVKMEDEITYRPAQLSLGERKLISIARALIISPELLFLDESLSSIDATLARRILNLISEFSARDNTTLVMVTYNKSLINEHTERIIIIDEKKIILDDRLENVLSGEIKERPEIFNDMMSF